MCGIGGILNLKGERHEHLAAHLSVINDLQLHRGPDGSGIWQHERGYIGFAHQRLQIIDIEGGQQPMRDAYGRTITYNGEIYNYVELRKQLSDYPFRSDSDTEVILAAYDRWGDTCLDHLRGMFAFALWDEREERLFCARDRFGVKPFYYAQVGDTLLFASEVKALLPFLPELKTHSQALSDYLVFQFCLGTKTLIEGIHELPPAYYIKVEKGEWVLSKYWEVYYDLDFDHTATYFSRELKRRIYDSVAMHVRSDVPVGTYISGGVDSSIIASVAAQHCDLIGFTGKFSTPDGFDESEYARAAAHKSGIDLYEVDISADDFLRDIENVIYHLDFPVAGPGAFPQYVVAKLAAQQRKVMLGGQGGDEIFGGYTRYLLAYFEQCIKAAINGTADSGNFIVTYESIIPNLTALRHYQPLMQEFWKEGLFAPLDARYFRLINRASTLQDEINWEWFEPYDPFASFATIFHGSNVEKESYFDSMTHFDFKTLLPALLHVEDRMSMAHGVESRVPFLDHTVVEFAATMPSNIKFKDGSLKRVLINALESDLPRAIIDRKDKMGFPVPLSHWIEGPLRPYIHDLFHSSAIRSRPYFHSDAIAAAVGSEGRYGRKVWGLLSLELWHRQFHDNHHTFRRRLQEAEASPLTSIQGSPL